MQCLHISRSKIEVKIICDYIFGDIRLNGTVHSAAPALTLPSTMCGAQMKMNPGTNRFSCNRHYIVSAHIHSTHTQHTNLIHAPQASTLRLLNCWLCLHGMMPEGFCAGRAAVRNTVWHTHVNPPFVGCHAIDDRAFETPRTCCMPWHMHTKRSHAYIALTAAGTPPIKAQVL